jgi:hypothetical protein
MKPKRQVWYKVLPIGWTSVPDWTFVVTVTTRAFIGSLAPWFRLGEDL